MLLRHVSGLWFSGVKTARVVLRASGGAKYALRDRDKAAVETARARAVNSARIEAATAYQNSESYKKLDLSLFWLAAMGYYVSRLENVKKA